MRTRLFLITTACLLFSSFLTAKSQESSIKSRYTIKASYARYVTGVRYNDKNLTTGNYRIEANYGFLKAFETGIYIGYSLFDKYYRSSDEYFSPFYGVNINFHPLDYFLNGKSIRFDLYLAGRFGGRYLPTPSNYNYAHHGHYNEYGLGGGLAYYPWRHVGFYAEYTYGKYYYDTNSIFADKTMLRYGISVKF